MKAKLNLTIDQKLLIEIKKYAEQHETNVSKLVESAFKKLVKKSTGPNNILEFIAQLEKPKQLPDGDLKDLYYQEKGKKYGL